MDGMTHFIRTGEIEILLLIQNNNLTKFDSKYDSGSIRLNGNTCLFTRGQGQLKL